MTGNIDTLKLAVLHDPLVGAICTPDEVWAEMDRREKLYGIAEKLPKGAADPVPVTALSRPR